MGLTVDKASVVCCVTQAKFQKFEAGIAIPIPTKINRMSSFANIYPSYFENEVSLQEFEAKLREQIERENYKYKGWSKTSPAILSEKLKSLREIHRLTQRQMALISNCLIDSYAYLERKRNGYLLFDYAPIVSCVANCFDIPFCDFLNNELKPHDFCIQYLERLEYQKKQNKKKED